MRARWDKERIGGSLDAHHLGPPRAGPRCPMHRLRSLALPFALVLLASCKDGGGGGAVDSGLTPDAGVDAGSGSLPDGTYAIVYRCHSSGQALASNVDQIAMILPLFKNLTQDTFTVAGPSRVHTLKSASCQVTIQEVIKTNLSYVFQTTKQQTFAWTPTSCTMALATTAGTAVGASAFANSTDTSAAGPLDISGGGSSYLLSSSIPSDLSFFGCTTSDRIDIVLSKQ